MKFHGILFLIFFITTSVKVFSQNLVPNPSFEDTIPCSTWLSGPPGPITDWFTPTISTPDWFGAGTICSPQTPANLVGFQIPRTGIAYAGFFSIDKFTPNLREYLSCHLTQTLQHNKKYCGGFFVSRAEIPMYFIDALGALLSTDTPLCTGGYCLLSFNPQIANPTGNVLGDTINWVLISGSFNAAGGEKFITIGDFIPDSLNTIDSLPPWNLPHSYYYLDDVFVEEMQIDTANAGGDKNICKGDSVQLGVAVCNGCIYAWNPTTDLSDATAAQPLVFPTQTATYNLTVRDTSTGTLCDWTSTDTVTVVVEPPCPQLTEIPNLFTPNGDGKNETFYIKNLPANSSLQIFNRWGSRVYKTDNYDNMWNGNKVLDGTYFYILALPDKKTKRGFLEIRR